MNHFEQIEDFGPDRGNLENVVIQLNQLGIIFGSSHLGSEEGDNILKRLGIEFRKEEIKGPTGHYAFNVIDYLKNTSVPKISPKAKSKLIENIEQLLTEKKSFEIDPREDGKTQFIGDKDNPLHIHVSGSYDVISGNYTLIFSDQTSVTKAKYELEVLTKQLIKLAKIGEGIAKIMHEMRNPLVAIGGFSDRLRKKVEDVNLKNYVDIIVGESKRLGAFIDQTLYYVKKPTDLKKEDVDLCALSQELYTRLKYDTNNKTINVTLEPCQSTITKGDREKLYEVLLNLTNNALEKEGVKNVIIRNYVKEGDAVIEVEDDGPESIPQDLKPKIFEPYITTKDKGTGLGLSIVATTIDYHNGRIEVESIPGRTVFSVYLASIDKII